MNVWKREKARLRTNELLLIGLLLFLNDCQTKRWKGKKDVLGAIQ